MKDQDRTRWTKLVADYEASELTQREFASERGISFSNLRNWIYRLRKESRPLVPEPAKASGQAPERGAAAEGSRLLPVRVVASAPKARRAVVAAARRRRPPRAGAAVGCAPPLPGRHGSPLPSGPRRGAGGAEGERRVTAR